MQHELRVYDDLDALARAGASYVADRARDAAARAEPFNFAVSGGKSPWQMLNQLATRDVSWRDALVFQVDERVVPADSDERNLKHLRACLAPINAEIVAMDVNAADLDAAALRYAETLPAQFNLVHLGLGPDGHCASLVPHDSVLLVTDRLVATSGPYQGTVRMTLTYPALSRARQLLWLVSGADKCDALARLLDGDESIPAGRVEAAASLVLADRAAMGTPA